MSTTNEKPALTAALQHVEPVVAAADTYVAERGIEHSGGIVEAAFEAGALWASGLALSTPAMAVVPVVKPGPDLWRVFEDATGRGRYWGIEKASAADDDDVILPPIRVMRETLEPVVAAHNAALAAPPAPAVVDGWPDQTAMRVIDPDQWEPCSPDYLRRGGDCAHAPRVWDDKSMNHWHPKLAASPASDLKAENERLLSQEYQRSNERVDNLSRDYEEIIDRKEMEIFELQKATAAYADANTMLINRAAEAEALSTALQQKLDTVTEALNASKSHATHLERAIKEEDPKPELLLRIGDVLKEVRAALQEVRG